MDCSYNFDKELRRRSDSRWGVTQFEMEGIKTTEQKLCNAKTK